ncbi:MAG: hypothetical protein QOI07_1428 [Verrucomicrobiota bacterium]|jgi:hypothetical protein
MRFFKYRAAANLEFNMLRRGEIYFPSYGELNDANECRPHFVLKGTDELWRRLSRFVLERVCFSSAFYREERSHEIGDLLRLSEPIGRRLRKSAANRDVSIGEFRKSFLTALAAVQRDKLHSVDWRLFTRLTAEVIDEQLPATLREEQYMASFSTDATNPTMWGHYGAAETGFVIIYETTNGAIDVHSPIEILYGTRPAGGPIGVTEIGFYRDKSLKLHEVVYRRTPPKVNAFHRLIHKFSYSEEESHYDVPEQLFGDASTKKEGMIGLVKYSDWSYEGEVRAFFPSFGLVPPDVRVLQVSARHMRGLIFGPKMSSADKARAVLCCHLMFESLAPQQAEIEEQCTFGFFQACQVANRFAYDIAPIGMLDGSFFGRHLPVREMRELDELSAAKLREMASILQMARSSSRRPTGRAAS